MENTFLALPQTPQEIYKYDPRDGGKWEAIEQKLKGYWTEPAILPLPESAGICKKT